MLYAWGPCSFRLICWSFVVTSWARARRHAARAMAAQETNNFFEPKNIFHIIYLTVLSHTCFVGAIPKWGSNRTYQEPCPCRPTLVYHTFAYTWMNHLSWFTTNLGKLVAVESTWKISLRWGNLHWLCFLCLHSKFINKLDNKENSK
jgi:hypothetical protein